MKDTEKKFGIVKMLAPASGFLAMVKPNLLLAIRPDLKINVPIDHIEEIIRLELVKRTFADGNSINFHLTDYEQMMETFTPEEKEIADNNLISLDHFRRAGFGRIEKSFLDYLAKVNLSPSTRQVAVSGRHITAGEDPHIGQDYTVTMDEKTLLTYLFPNTLKNIESAIQCIEKLISLDQLLTGKNIQRLGELFGVENDPLWQAFLKNTGKDGISPREQKPFSSDQLKEFLQKARVSLTSNEANVKKLQTEVQFADKTHEQEQLEEERQKKILEDRIREEELDKKTTRSRRKNCQRKKKNRRKERKFKGR
jgi:hypothetical protein